MGSAIKIKRSCRNLTETCAGVFLFLVDLLHEQEKDRFSHPYDVMLMLNYDQLLLFIVVIV